MEEEGRALREKVMLALEAALGLARRKDSGTDFAGKYARVEIYYGRKFGRSNFESVTAKVDAYNFSPRPSTFRLKTFGATDDAVAQLAGKVAAKFQEFEREGDAVERRAREWERRKRDEDGVIAEFMAAHFPEFGNTYGRTYSRKDDLDLDLEAYIDDGAVAFRVKFSKHMSAEDAREMADLTAKLMRPTSEP